MKEHFELLGKRVRDRVTGFAGVATSLSFDLYGCVQVVVTPPVDEKGERKDGTWYDVVRLEVLDPVPVLTAPSFEPVYVHGPEAKPQQCSSNPVR